MQQTHGKSLVNQTVDLDTKTIRKSGVVADGSLFGWLYVHFDTLKDFIRRITGINNVIRVKAVFTSNITISASGATVDGYTLLNNDTVLVAGQTDTTQNGLYTWNTGGALTRLAPFTNVFAAGLAILNIALQGRIFHVLNGNINRNTFWYFDSPTQFPIIDTSSLLFYNVANLKVSTASNNLVVQGNDGIEVKIRNTGTDIFGGLQFDATTREFYIITSSLPGASGSLTIENYLGTVLGVAAKMRFSNKFNNTWDGANSRITVDLDAANSLQTGDIIFLGSASTVRSGFLRCDGATVSTATYPELQLAVGNQFLTNVNIMPLLGNPAMTSNTAPAGYIANASTNSAFAYSAFDGVNSNPNSWQSSTWTNGTTPPTVGGEWVRLEFPTTKIIGRLIIHFGSTLTTILTGKIQGSNDNTNWTDLATLTSLASGGGVIINMPKPFKTYRLLVQTITGTNAQIAEVVFYESTQFSLPNTSASTTTGQVIGQIKT